MECFTDGNCVVVVVDKELDHHMASIIRTKVDRYLMTTGAKNVVFDFSKTEFMDSSGIGVIMGRYKVVKSFGGKIALTNQGKSVSRIVSISGLHKIVDIFETRQEAIKAYGGEENE